MPQRYLAVVARRPLARAAGGALLVLLLTSCAASSPSPVTAGPTGPSDPQAGVILIVRHADRASSAADSPLSAAGERRAACLAETLRAANLAAVYVSDLQRTQQTAAPAAQAAHRQPHVVPKARLDELVEDLRAEPAGTILVVGHSDTLPTLVERLGGGTVAPVREDEFDRLIVLPRRGRQVGPAVVLRYCAGFSAAP